MAAQTGPNLASPLRSPAALTSSHSTAESFERNFYVFHKFRGATVPNFPVAGTVPVGPYQLAETVERFGGYVKINREDLWQALVQALNVIPSEQTVAQVKTLYIQFILPFLQNLRKSTQPQANGTPNQASSAPSAPAPAPAQPTNAPPTAANSVGNGTAPAPPERSVTLVPYNPLKFDTEEYLGGLFQNRIFLALRSNLPNEVDWAFNRLLRVSKYCRDDFDIRCIPGLVSAINEHLKRTTVALVVSYLGLDPKTATQSDQAMSHPPITTNPADFFTLRERAHWERLLQIVTVYQNFAELESATRLLILTDPCFVEFIFWVLHEPFAVLQSVHPNLLTQPSVDAHLPVHAWSVTGLNTHWNKVLRLPSPFTQTELRHHCLDMVETMCLAVPIERVPAGLPRLLRRQLFSSDRSLVVYGLKCLSYALLREHPQAGAVLDVEVMTQFGQLLLAPDMELLYLVLDFLTKVADQHRSVLIGLLPALGKCAAKKTLGITANQLVVLLLSRLDEQCALLFPPKADAPTAPVASRPELSKPTSSTATPTATAPPRSLEALKAWLLTNLESAPPVPNPAGADKPLVPHFILVSEIYDAYIKGFGAKDSTTSGGGARSAAKPPQGDLLSLNDLMLNTKGVFPILQIVRHPKNQQPICLHIRKKQPSFLPPPPIPVLGQSGVQTPMSPKVPPDSMDSVQSPVFAEPHTTTIPAMSSIECRWAGCAQKFSFTTAASPSGSLPPEAVEDAAPLPPNPTRAEAVQALWNHIISAHALPGSIDQSMTGAGTQLPTEACQWQGCSGIAWPPSSGVSPQVLARRILGHLKTHLPDQTLASAPLLPCKDSDASAESNVAAPAAKYGSMANSTVYWGSLDHTQATQHRQQIVVRLLLLLRTLAAHPESRALLSPYGSRLAHLTTLYPPLCRDVFGVLQLMEQR
ncbi:Chromatin structure-remodeling complex protein rsc9 [Dimargaris verticillata]|uniref:Chromatin structure-remodeling complex protein rsc9 n=1 Tax=Dimargaris verticillata TaxID=2761393 RepID=A0A9W8EAE1_9FUNG|nr:Chromatin structure-remodeling complex protein rsc9 [Dimargaris verticillata]